MSSREIGVALLGLGRAGFDCIRGGSRVPITHDEVRTTHLLADAAERSFREHAPVEVAS